MEYWWIDDWQGKEKAWVKKLLRPGSFIIIISLKGTS
jgi:hypothetical protein